MQTSPLAVDITRGVISRSEIDYRIFDCTGHIMIPKGLLMQVNDFSWD